MSPHTPGPWVIRDGSPRIVYVEHFPVVAPWDADALLIAAAPKMLETLKAVVEFLEPQACADCACEGSNPACNMLNEIEQAIAEAEGQS